MNAENTIKVSVAPAGKLVFRNNYRGRECFYFKSSYHNYLTSNMACCAVICTHSPANSFGLWNSVFGRFPCLYTAPISFQMQLAKPSFPVLANSFNSLLSHPCVVTFSIKKFFFFFFKEVVAATAIFYIQSIMAEHFFSWPLTLTVYCIYWTSRVFFTCFFVGVSASSLPERHMSSEVSAEHGPAKGRHGVDSHQAADEGVLAALEQGHNVGTHVVSVLLPEVLDEGKTCFQNWVTAYFFHLKKNVRQPL